MSEFIAQLLDGDRDAILLAAAAYFALMGVIAVLRCIHIGRWSSTTGVLESAGIERTGSVAFEKSDQEYEAQVRYRYRVDGTEYLGTRLNGWSIMATYNLRFILKYQFRGIERLDGDHVVVYYNPYDPAKSYLDVPGLTSILVVGGLCFGSALLLLGARF